MNAQWTSTAAPPAASRTRNTLVARANQPAGPSPVECEQGLSPAPALRVEVAEIPVPEVEPADVPAPPSGALRTALQDAQSALARNDRPAFDQAISEASSLMSNYPSGAERRAAEDVLRLHQAAGRLWDAQYQSPFFGEDDPIYATVSVLPGYAEAVRRSVLTDQSGRRFYPAAESREFVTRLASERLPRLGIRPTTTRAVRTETRREPRVAESTPRRPPTRATTSRSTTSRSTPSASRTTTSRATSSPSHSTPSRSTPPRTTASRSTSSPTTPRATTATRSAASTPQPSQPAPVTPAPGSPNPPAPPTTAAVPAPAPAAVSQSNHPDTPPAPDTGDVASTTTTASTDTATTFADTALSTDVIPATPKPVAGRSVILPTILILIGLGVLIVLFRASK